ncbi:MAG: hypothetical protein J6T16_07885, partial [Opitutales bacterium]|nr:hypothetical protein [Opitutales bacterium]
AQGYVPLWGPDYYRTLNPDEAIVRAGRISSAANLVRETFIVRYAPHSIKSDADILARIEKYAQVPNMRYRDIGWLFETYVKNRYETFVYVKKSTAPFNDLTGRLPDGRFTNAQLKAHKSGNPKTYFKDMLKGYNALFVIPDDHVAPLKNYLKNLARERDYLASIENSETFAPEQKARLKTLRGYNIESKIHRVKGGGITYAGLERLLERGIAQIRKNFEKKSK